MQTIDFQHTAESHAVVLQIKIHRPTGFEFHLRRKSRSIFQQSTNRKEEIIASLIDAKLIEEFAKGDLMETARLLRRVWARAWLADPALETSHGRRENSINHNGKTRQGTIFVQRHVTSFKACRVLSHQPRISIKEGERGERTTRWVGTS